MKEQETKKGLLAKLQSGKLLEVLVILILAIIVIIILYNAFYKDKEDVSASGKGDYATEQEAKLVSVLSKLDGVGKVQVMISLADEGETVIAYETVQKADGTIVTTPVLVNGEVVVLEKRPPEIAGVLIVAEGAENLAVRFNLIDAAASVLNINKSIIKVYENGSGKGVLKNVENEENHYHVRTCAVARRNGGVQFRACGRDREH